jgi:hypothetical protein
MIEIKYYSILNKNQNEDVEIKAPNLFYCNNLIGNKKFWGIQVDNIKKVNEIERICKRISEDVRNLDKLLGDE